MSDLINKKIDQILELIDEGKEAEALRLTVESEHNNSFPTKDNLILLSVKAYICLFLGSFEESLKIADYLYKESRNNNFSLGIAAANMVKISCQTYMGKNLGFDVNSLFLEAENQIEAGLQESKKFTNMLLAWINMNRGQFYYGTGSLNLAITHTKIALEIIEKEKYMKASLPICLMIMGSIYKEKGELKLSLTCFNKSIQLYKGESIATIFNKVYTYYGLGQVYQQRGKWNLAVENYELALEYNKNLMFTIYSGWIYTSLIQVFLNDKSLEKARRYLEQFEEYNLKHNNIHYDLYQYSKANVLRSTRKIKNLAEAENILERLLEQENLNIFIQIPSIILLSNIYLIELGITEDIEMLTKIQLLITQLQKIAEGRGSYTTLTSSKLLQGKLALIQMNLDDARLYLSEAQALAEKHGLQKLAHSISREHDKLLEQLDQWKTVKKTKQSVSERLKLASIDETIERMIDDRVIEPIKLTPETPILLLITVEGGILLFSHPFADEWKFDDDLFSSFLNSFSSISDEIFSEGLDRAKFGQYTVLMKSVRNFSLCYLFKGTTYLAQKKLKKFSEQLQNSTEVKEALNKYYESNQVLRLKDLPPLETLITEIFIDETLDLKGLSLKG